MDDLIKLILTLPEIKLSDREWAELSAILSPLEDRSPLKLIEAINNQKNELVDNLKLINLVSTNVKLMSFLNAYVLTTTQVQHWLHTLGDIWLLITDNPLAADYIIPVTMALLPDNPEQLKALFAKVELACQISDPSEFGYGLITLYSATKQKILDISRGNTNTSTADEVKIPPTLKLELSALRMVNSLDHACEEYRQNLIEYLFERVKLECKDRLTTYLTELNVTEAQLDKSALIERLFTESLDSNNKFSPELAFYFHKYIAVFELHLTLIRIKSLPSHKLEEFHAKFDLHSALLVKNMDIQGRTFAKPPGFFSSSRFYDLLGWKSKEESFLELSKNCIALIAQESSKQETIITATPAASL